ncbi:hypothetical protein GY45DRAFT_1320954 [Cubamyces sp. BRFM 1775]|nr:hypothetical protein GY45DRAFT_1320954 [Cubamyces sp. BRFM 1775]
MMRAVLAVYGIREWTERPRPTAVGTTGHPRAALRGSGSQYTKRPAVYGQAASVTTAVHRGRGVRPSVGIPGSQYLASRATGMGVSRTAEKALAAVLRARGREGGRGSRESWGTGRLQCAPCRKREEREPSLAKCAKAAKRERGWRLVIWALGRGARFAYRGRHR